MLGRAADDGDTRTPATLHRVMQETIAYGLHERYKVQRHIPHELFVLLMQMNQKTTGGKSIKRSPPKSRQTSAPLAKRASKLPSFAPTA
jgi:hypothetical protein